MMLRRKSSRGRQFSRFTLEIQARLGSKARPLGWMVHERTPPSDTPARCKGVAGRQDSRLASVSSFINGEPLGRCISCQNFEFPFVIKMDIVIITSLFFWWQHRKYPVNINIFSFFLKICTLLRFVPPWAIHYWHI